MSLPVDPSGPVSKFLQVRERFGFILSHIDHKPIRAKIQTFTFFCVIYSVASVVFVWRFPYIWAAISSLMPSKSHPSDSWSRSFHSASSFARLVARLLVHYGDLYLVTKLLPDAMEFFTVHLKMRLDYGFREAEIVFRRPTLLSKLLTSAAGEGEGVASVTPQIKSANQWVKQLYIATDRRLLEKSTGLWTATQYWAIDFDRICDAYEALETGQIPLETWESAMWFQHSSGSWRTTAIEKVRGPKFATTRTKAFKKGLEEMGRADLWKEWMEKVAEAKTGVHTFDSNTIGTLIFEREGLDFQEFLDKMGERALKARTL